MKRFIKHVLPLLILACQADAQSLSLSVKDALATGKAGNRHLQIEILEKQRLAASVSESKANLKPAVSINGSYNVFGERPVIYLRDETSVPMVNPVKFGGRYAFDAALTASYPVLHASYYSNMRMARLKWQMQTEKIRATEQDLVLSINEFYYSIILKNEQEMQLEQSLLRNQKALSDARSLFLQGKALKSDTLANFIGVQNLIAAISQVKNDRLRMEADLRQLLGVDNSVALVLTDSLHATEPVLQVSSAQYSIALDERPDIRESKLLLKMSVEERRNNRNMFLPQLWLAGQYQLQAQADKPLVWSGQIPATSFLGLRLTVPVYSGSKSRYIKAQSITNIRQNEIAMEELQQRVEAELVTAGANLREAVTQLQIQRVRVQAAEISYNMLRNRYNQGLSSRLELSDAELSLTNARLNTLQAIYEMKMRELQYKKANGTLSFSSF